MKFGVLVTLLLAGAISAACGGSANSLDPGSDFVTGTPSGSSTTTDGGSSSSLFNDTPTDSGAATAACQTGAAQAQAVPLHLVVALDRSGSMCEYDSNADRNCANVNSKWQQTRFALQAFFSSAQSSGMSVSLIAFPYSDGGDYCSTNHYTTPVASEVALPDSQNVLLAAIDKNPSTGNGATPTRDAYRGAIQIAQGIKTSLGTNPGKVALLVATDGIPSGCGDSIDDSATLAQGAVSAGIPTYVLGVGDQLSALNKLGNAGSTGNALTASTSNPATVGQQVTDALNKIRVAALSCDYQVPAAPAGKTLDPAQVNVEYTGGTPQTKSTLPYSKDCASGSGWQYDDPTNPKTIKLCANTCSQVSADPNAHLDFVFGCETVGDKVR